MKLRVSARSARAARQRLCSEAALNRMTHFRNRLGRLTYGFRAKLKLRPRRLREFHLSPYRNRGHSHRPPGGDTVRLRPSRTDTAARDESPAPQFWERSNDSSTRDPASHPCTATARRSPAKTCGAAAAFGLRVRRYRGSSTPERRRRVAGRRPGGADRGLQARADHLLRGLRRDRQGERDGRNCAVRAPGRLDHEANSQQRRFSDLPSAGL